MRATVAAKVPRPVIVCSVSEGRIDEVNCEMSFATWTTLDGTTLSTRSIIIVSSSKVLRRQSTLRPP